MTKFKVVFFDQEPVEVEGVKIYSDSDNYFIELDDENCAAFDRSKVKCIMPVDKK